MGDGYRYSWYNVEGRWWRRGRKKRGNPRRREKGSETFKPLGVKDDS